MQKTTPTDDLASLLRKRRQLARRVRKGEERALVEYERTNGEIERLEAAARLQTLLDEDVSVGEEELRLAEIEARRRARMADLRALMVDAESALNEAIDGADSGLDSLVAGVASVQVARGRIVAFGRELAELDPESGRTGNERPPCPDEFIDFVLRQRLYALLPRSFERAPHSFAPGSFRELIPKRAE